MSHHTYAARSGRSSPHLQPQMYLLEAGRYLPIERHLDRQHRVHAASTAYWETQLKRGLISADELGVYISLTIKIRSAWFLDMTDPAGPGSIFFSSLNKPVSKSLLFVMIQLTLCVRQCWSGWFMCELVEEYERKVWRECQTSLCWQVALTAEDVQEVCEYREIDLEAMEDFAWESKEAEMHIHLDKVPRKWFPASSYAQVPTASVSIEGIPRSQPVQEDPFEPKEEAEKQVASKEELSETSPEENSQPEHTVVTRLKLVLKKSDSWTQKEAAALVAKIEKNATNGPAPNINKKAAARRGPTFVPPPESRYPFRSNSVKNAVTGNELNRRRPKEAKEASNSEISQPEESEDSGYGERVIEEQNWFQQQIGELEASIAAQKERIETIRPGLPWDAPVEHNTIHAAAADDMELADAKNDDAAGEVWREALDIATRVRDGTPWEPLPGENHDIFTNFASGPGISVETQALFHQAEPYHPENTEKVEDQTLPQEAEPNEINDGTDEPEDGMVFVRKSRCPY